MLERTFLHYQCDARVCLGACRSACLHARVCVCVCQEVDCCGGGAVAAGLLMKVCVIKSVHRGPRLRPASLKLHLIENGTAVMI